MLTTSLQANTRFSMQLKKYVTPVLNVWKATFSSKN